MSRDNPYNKREIDLLFRGISDELHELKNKPFEKDVRESLSRVETEIGQVKIYIEERVRQERERNDKTYAPYILWTAVLTIAGIWAALEIPGILKILNLVQ